MSTCSSSRRPTLQTALRRASESSSDQGTKISAAEVRALVDRGLSRAELRELAFLAFATAPFLDVSFSPEALELIEREVSTRKVFDAGASSLPEPRPEVPDDVFGGPLTNCTAWPTQVPDDGYGGPLTDCPDRPIRVPDDVYGGPLTNCDAGRVEPKAAG